MPASVQIPLSTMKLVEMLSLIQEYALAAPATAETLAEIAELARLSIGAFEMELAEEAAAAA